jgi:hypothetical protein
MAHLMMEECALKDNPNGWPDGAHSWHLGDPVQATFSAILFATS